jgi:predicted 3-demethylubiquinone-9 3-methyltransferase (glyoxalase superfamily)
MQKITPFLWFNTNAEEAVKFYMSVFKKSKIKTISRYGKSSANAPSRPAGSVMTIHFELNGQDFVALNGGPSFKFNESISFFVNCKTQAEIDYYWKKLTAGGGEEVACGWLKDKFGVAWQIVPENIGDLISSKDPEKSDRVMKAVVQMVKLDIKKLKAAAAVKPSSISDVHQ